MNVSVKLDKVLKICAVVLLLVGVVLTTVGVYMTIDLHKAKGEYKETEAVIEKIESKTNSESGIVHTPVVSYEADGQLYTEKLSTYSSSMRVGDTIIIMYNPKDPTDIRYYDAEMLISGVLAICGIVLMISSFLFPLFVRLRRSKMRID